MTMAGLALALGWALDQPFSTLKAQGSLTPPGAPAPMMKSLDQIEPRTPIGSAPFTMDHPGSYYLTANLAVDSGTALSIETNGVRLDLNGFSLASVSTGGVAIYLANNLQDIAIVNGTIRGGVTNNGSGVYEGPGFYYGIVGSGLANVRVAGVSVSGCKYSGINLGAGGSTVVESCTVKTVGAEGISAGIIKHSTAVDCGGDAIRGESVSDSRGESSGGNGIQAVTAQNSVGVSQNGTGISARTAVNCHGTTGTNSLGYGLSARVASHCQGYYGAAGVLAKSAFNCFGYADGVGSGVYADSAQNCQGESGGSGWGITAETAHNCVGKSASGIGIKTTIATGCFGYSATGKGLNSTIANACAGNSLEATHRYNMPAPGR